MKIGFIGLGIMGKPMAKNILKAGYPLVAFDHHQENIAEIVAAGGQAAGSAKEVGQEADVVITMLQNTPNVQDAIFGENSLSESLRAGNAVIDMSSIAPEASRHFAEKLQEKAIDFLDAPVSGGEPKAIDGTIAVMVGGEQAVFDKYLPLLQTMASSVSRVGEVGAGNVAKLANQMIVAINIAAISEAYSLAEKSHVDPNAVYQAIRNGLAGSTVMEQKSEKIFSGDWDPGFRIELHVKDLQNALESAQALNLATPFSSLAMNILQSLMAKDHGKEDHSAIARFYEDINAIKLQD